MITTKSFCTAKMWSETNLSLAIERARPSAALNSSTHPYASTRGSAFETRRPYINDVSPLSPVLVTMDTRQIVGCFCETPIHYTASDRDALQIICAPTQSLAAARLLPLRALQLAHVFQPVSSGDVRGTQSRPGS